MMVLARKFFEAIRSISRAPYPYEQEDLMQFRCVEA